MFRFPHPLYALYPGPVDGPDAVEETILALCEGGAALIQYRERHLPDGDALAIARRVVQVARREGVAVVVNDRADLARLADAEGVHLGQEDLIVADARRLLGRKGIVGVSVDTAEEARAAEEEGADYVSLGPAYPTASKADVPEPRPLALYERLARELHVPLVAIGGITASNVGPLVRAGVQAVAVLSALYAGPDVRLQAGSITRAFLQAGDADDVDGGMR